MCRFPDAITDRCVVVLDVVVPIAAVQRVGWPSGTRHEEKWVREKGGRMIGKAA